jgi:hypothetical protein
MWSASLVGVDKEDRPTSRAFGFHGQVSAKRGFTASAFLRVDYYRSHEIMRACIHECIQRYAAKDKGESSGMWNERPFLNAGKVKEGVSLPWEAKGFESLELPVCGCSEFSAALELPTPALACSIGLRARRAWITRIDIKY